MRSPGMAAWLSAIMTGAAASFFGATEASAGAFQLNERSTAAQGASFAGSVSAASDVTFIGFNPAALTTVEHIELGNNVSVVAPISNGRVETGPFAGTELDADRIGVVPAIAAGYRITDDIILGFATFSPFGLATEYSDNSPVAGDATDSELKTIGLSPMAAYEVTDNLTIGASFDILYLEAELASAAVDLEGDSFDFSFSVGAHYEPIPGTKLGVAYHHGYDFTVGTNSFMSLDGEVEASLPNWVQLGITQDITDNFRVMAEGRWINWSRFDSIDITTPALAGTPFGFVSDEQNYTDAFFVAGGAEYDWSDALTLRGGLAWDETPTTDEFRTVRVPDEDRIWVSVGASFKYSEHLTVDAAYSYLRSLRDPEVTLRNGPLAGTRIEYEGGAHIFSVGGSLHF